MTCTPPSRPNQPACVILAILASVLTGACQAQPKPAPAALVLERRIELAGVRGRIDHLALNTAGRRLFVAELGNGSVEALDLVSGRSLGRIDRLSEPQGLAYLPKRDELVVATGGDGMVRFYRARDLTLTGSLSLSSDADNVRVDPTTGFVEVGYGGGGIAIIDPAGPRRVQSVALPAHPEAFQIVGGRIYVNLPNANKIAVIDTAASKVVASWVNPPLAGFNFPMAIERRAGLLASVYRAPARLVLYRTDTGSVSQNLGSCGDADDVWFDSRRSRIYVVCGSGAVRVFAQSGGDYTSWGNIDTRRGARTGLFSPDLDQLFVAVRASGHEPAAIWVFRPH